MPPRACRRWTPRRVAAGAGLLALLGCNTAPKSLGFDLTSLVAGSPDEEPMPSLEEARAAPKVLVLPLANRAAPNRIGRIHHALDDLLRRDLMCLPHLSVFPDGAVPVSIAALHTQEYRSLDTALRAADRVGATHVVFGEVATAGDQIAVEVDIVDVRAQRVAHTVRVQQIERKLDKALRTLRAEVIAHFYDPDVPAAAYVPGPTPPYERLQKCGYGDTNAALGNYSAAILDYYGAAQTKGGYADAMVGIADTQLRLGAMKLAEAAYASALGHDEEAVETYWRFALMQIYGERTRSPVGLALLQQASERAPLFGPAHLTLGTLWFEEKRYDHAEKHFRVAEVLMPMSLWPHYNQAQVLRRRGDLAGARVRLERAAAMGPREGRVLAELGLLLHDLGDEEAALIQLRAAADADPSNALYLYYVGEQFDRLNQPRIALAAYQAAAAYPLNDVALYTKLGAVFVAADLLADAERILGAGYADSVRDPRLVLLYARVLLLRGRENPVRRHDYGTRAGTMLGQLLRVPLSDAHRTEAEALAQSAMRMRRR